MNPGRELDALVAEKIMGWKERSGQVTVTQGYNRVTGESWVDIPSLPHYSTDISVAWAVVDKLADTSHGGFELVALRHPDKVGHMAFAVRFHGKSLAEVTGLTAPHAICLAALKAVGHDQT